MQKKHYILMVSTILFILVAILIVVIRPEESTESFKSSAHSNQSESLAIFSEDDLSEVHIHLNQESDHGVKIVRNLEGKWEIPHAEETISEFKLGQTLAIIQAITSQIHESIGIDQSQVNSQTMKSNPRITLINESGDKQHLNIGKKSNDGSSYYLTMANTMKVYPVNAQVIDQLPLSVDDLYDLLIVKVTPEKLNKIVIRNRMQTIELLPHSPYSD